MCFNRPLSIRVNPDCGIGQQHHKQVDLQVRPVSLGHACLVPITVLSSIGISEMSLTAKVIHIAWSSQIRVRHSEGDPATRWKPLGEVELMLILVCIPHEHVWLSVVPQGLSADFAG